MLRTTLGLVALAMASPTAHAAEDFIAKRVDRAGRTERALVARTFFSGGLDWFFQPGSSTESASMRGHAFTLNGGIIHEVTACLYNTAPSLQTFKTTVSVEQGVFIRELFGFQSVFPPQSVTCHTLPAFNSAITAGPFNIHVQFNKSEVDNRFAGLPATDSGELFDVQIGSQRPPLANSSGQLVTIRGVGISYLIEENDNAPPPPPPPPPPSGSCVRDAQTACILNGRFEVRVSMKNFANPPVTFPGIVQLYNGQSSETDQSVSFYTFNNGNVEVFVKMVNACSTTTPAFWLFAAGATNAETEISVRDTVSGQAQEIHNPPGLLFETVAHPGAFFTCP